jgi:hypothetical protein
MNLAVITLMETFPRFPAAEDILGGPEFPPDPARFLQIAAGAYFHR